jgi:hypothetical protein
MFSTSIGGLNNNIGGPAMHALRTLLLFAAAGAALLANGSAGADTPAAVAIAYVPNSLAEAYIANGPWTLHQKDGGQKCP